MVDAGINEQLTTNLDKSDKVDASVGRAEIADLPDQYRVLESSDGEIYKVFDANKARHLKRGANEAVTLFATRQSDKEKVAIKVFLGWQTRYPEVRAAEFHRAIAELSEEERLKLLEDTPRNREHWERKLERHVWTAGHQADLATSESFFDLIGGPAVTMAAMESVPEGQLELEGYGFVSTDGRIEVTKSGPSPEVMTYDEGHPAIVTKYVEGNLVYLDARAKDNQHYKPPRGTASREVYLKNEARASQAKQKLVEVGFDPYDIDIYVDPKTNSLYLMDLGQIIPKSTEAIQACIDAVVKLYNLPEIFVRMVANKYWHGLTREG